MSGIGSPRVDGPPVMSEDPYAYVVTAFQAPPSPDYVPGPKEPKQAPLSLEFVPYLYTHKDPYAYVVTAFQAPPSPDYVPGPKEPKQAPLSLEFVPEPIYPEFMPPEDDVLPAEEQPLPVAVLPTADSPGYIHKSDPEEDPVDYPADEGDDDYDDDESSDDNKDDDEDVEEDEEEEEHPAPADSVPPPVHYIPSPPLQVLSPVPVSPLPLPASPTYPLGYIAAMIRQRAESPSTSHSLPLPQPIILSHTRAYVAMMRVAAPSTYILAYRSETPPSGTPPLIPILAPTSSPLLLLPSTDHRADKPEVCLPPQKRLCIAFGSREIRRDPERDVGYRITDTWDEMLEDMPRAPTTDETELGRDRRSHAYTALLIERERLDFPVRLRDGRWMLVTPPVLR
ncbi:hypothetical protein Tco_1434464 [Tanacetum coccineum]